MAPPSLTECLFIDYDDDDDDANIETWLVFYLAKLQALNTKEARVTPLM